MRYVTKFLVHSLQDAESEQDACNETVEYVLAVWSMAGITLWMERNKSENKPEKLIDDLRGLQ